MIGKPLTDYQYKFIISNAGLMKQKVKENLKNKKKNSLKIQKSWREKCDFRNKDTKVQANNTLNYEYLFKIFEKVYLSDEVYSERYKKYFKTHYNGKPTKRYLKLENKII